MGWIEPRGGSYRARWRVGGELVSVTCDTAAQAEAVLADAGADLRRGTYIDPRDSRILLGDWADEWIETRPHLKNSSDSTDRGRMRNHIKPHLGHLRLDQVAPTVIRRWIGTLQSKGLASKTIRNCHGLLYSLLQAAVDEKMIAANPCKATKLPERDHAEMYFLTQEEVGRLIKATPQHYRPLIVTLLGTGIRWGEAAGLRRRRVDVVFGRRLEVAETLEEVDGRLAIGTPKSRRSRRFVSLPAAAVEALTPLVDGDPEGYVFTTPSGARLRRHNFKRRVWAKILEEAKLPPTVRVHDLRHTHAAHLIAAGRPLTAISRRLGHASIAVTNEVYGHLLPEVDEGVIVALDELLSPSRDVVPVRDPGDRSGKSESHATGS